MKITVVFFRDSHNSGSVTVCDQIVQCRLAKIPDINPTFTPNMVRASTFAQAALPVTLVSSLTLSDEDEISSAATMSK